MRRFASWALLLTHFSAAISLYDQHYYRRDVPAAPSTASYSPLPSSTSSPPSDRGLSITPQPNGDLQFAFSTDLKSTLIATARDKCSTAQNSSCQAQLQAVLLGGQFKLQKKDPVIVGSLIAILVSWVAAKLLNYGLSSDPELMPSSIDMPAAVKQNLENGPSATASASLSIPLITSAPTAKPLISTATSNADEIKAGDTVVNLDAPLRAWFEETAKNSSCSKLRKRDSWNCAIAWSEKAITAFNDGPFGSFEGFSEILTPPSGYASFLSALAEVKKFGQYRPEMSLVGSALFQSISIILLAISIKISEDGKVQSMYALPFGGGTVSSAVTGASKYVIYAKMSADRAYIDKNMKSILPRDSISYYTWLTDAHNYWTVTNANTFHSSAMAAISGVETVRPLTSLKSHSESFLDSADAARETTEPMMRKRREMRMPIVKAQVSGGATDQHRSRYFRKREDEVTLKAKEADGNSAQWREHVRDLKLLDAPLSWDSDDIELLDGMDHIYPDLENEWVLIYVLEEGFDCNHPDIKHLKDKGWFQPDPLIHDSIKVSGDPYCQQQPMSSHGTHMVSKIAGLKYGVNEAVRIKLVWPPQDGSGLDWMYRVIHDDIKKASATRPRFRTLVYAALMWYFGPYQPDEPALPQEPTPAEVIAEFAQEPWLAGLKDVLRGIMIEEDVPLIASAGNNVEQYELKQISELPQLLANDQNIPIVIVGGCNYGGTAEPRSKASWPQAVDGIQPKVTTYTLHKSWVANVQYKKGASPTYAYGLSFGTSTAAAIAVMNVAHAMVMNDRFGLRIFEQSQGKFTQSVLRFYRDGQGSKVRTKTKAATDPRVMWSLLDGTLGVEQCPNVKGLAPRDVCGARNRPSTGTVAATAASSHPIVTSSPTDKSASLTANCQASQVPSGSTMLEWQSSDIPVAVSQFCNGVLGRNPLPTPTGISGPLSIWAYKNVAFSARMKGNQCSNSTQSEKCNTDLASVMRQCPDFGGYLTEPGCMGFAIFPVIEAT